MVVLGVIIETFPQKTEQVKKTLSNMKEIVMSNEIDEHRLIAIIESKTLENEISISKAVANIDGVFSTSPSAYYFRTDLNM